MLDQTPPAAPPDGQALPLLVSALPGPRSRALLELQADVAAPMGPPRPTGDQREPTLVMTQGSGVNVFDADGNRYVDFAAGFGSLLLGHAHPAVLAALNTQSTRLLQALGDVYPSDTKLLLMQRLNALYPRPAACIVTQSGSDSVTAALKTAALVTGRTGVLAFRGAYHGLGYGPLSLCGLRESYAAPFAAQLNRQVSFVGYPQTSAELDACLSEARRALSEGSVGAVVVEPILGRGGVLLPPAGFLSELAALAREAAALLVADEIWTGLGRAGSWLRSTPGIVPDLICLGKGLGGGLPISAVIGERTLMQHWSRQQEVVHTSTFAGAPLACATALATLTELADGGWVERAATTGSLFRAELERRLQPSGAEVRGAGFMLGIEPARAGLGLALQRRLLELGYITSTGGGRRDVLVLTPPLVMSAALLSAFADTVAGALDEVSAA